MATFNAGDPFAREWLRDILRVEDVTVTFIKQSTGEQRVINCTLRSDAIEYTKKSSKESSLTDDNIAVWDLQNNAWRSFRYDSITHIQRSGE